MDRNELYLKTAFCCMACDGNIADQEIDLLKRMAYNDNVFEGLKIQEKINEYITAINNYGISFLNNFIDEVKNEKLDEDASLQLIKIAIDTIEADEKIEYSEISFFKKLRKCLAINDELILAKMPDKEDYLLPDIEKNTYTFEWNATFDNIEITCPEL